jgi:thiamine-monophosphate kinase
MPLPEKASSGSSCSADLGKVDPGRDRRRLRRSQAVAGSNVLVTTDFTLEAFTFGEWHSPEVVGRRCLTRGLSDIAAMGGNPRGISFARLAQQASAKWVDGFMRGLLALAREYDAPLAGGDTAQSPQKVLADIVVLGTVPKGTAVLRSGAKPGDRAYVTGELGGGSAALKEFFAGRKPRAQDFPRHFHPVPRLAVGEFLRGHGMATAMIDLSDGLSTDLGHICDELGVGAEIMADDIPRAGVGPKQERVDLKLALHGGEDYELLFTAPARKRVPTSIAGVPVTAIGRITRARGVMLRGSTGATQALKPQGWEHFRR